jgi:hypothetical protein
MATGATATASSWRGRLALASRGHLALVCFFFFSSAAACATSKEKKAREERKKHAGETPAGRKGKMPSPRRTRDKPHIRLAYGTMWKWNVNWIYDFS